MWIIDIVCFDYFHRGLPFTVVIYTCDCRSSNSITMPFW